MKEFYFTKRITTVSYFSSVKGYQILEGIGMVVYKKSLKAGTDILISSIARLQNGKFNHNFMLNQEK